MCKLVFEQVSIRGVEAGLYESNLKCQLFPGVLIKNLFFISQSI